MHVLSRKGAATTTLGGGHVFRIFIVYDLSGLRNDLTFDFWEPAYWWIFLVLGLWFYCCACTWALLRIPKKYCPALSRSELTAPTFFDGAGSGLFCSAIQGVNAFFFRSF